MSECELFWTGGTLLWVGGGGWENILVGWGWVGMNGGEWGWVGVRALFDIALYLNLSVSNFYITTLVNEYISA